MEETKIKIKDFFNLREHIILHNFTLKFDEKFRDDYYGKIENGNYVKTKLVKLLKDNHNKFSENEKLQAHEYYKDEIETLPKRIMFCLMYNCPKNMLNLFFSLIVSLLDETSTLQH